VTVRDELRAFAANVLILNKDLDRIESRFQIDLDRVESTDPATAEERGYYAQFPLALRAEAAAMGRHYETFFCLENSIRDLVSSKLSVVGPDWWDKHVPQSVKDAVDLNRRREAEAGVSLRSAQAIDYTTFGELLVIMEANWDVFSDTFNNQKALRRVLSGLNMLRAPIAHCASLASDEVTRLELSIKDYYRLME
jgi:Swt1-like HEPN